MKIIHRAITHIPADTPPIGSTYLRVSSSGDDLTIRLVNAGGNDSVMTIRLEDFADQSMTHVFWSTCDQGFIAKNDASRWRDLQSHLWFNDGCKYGMALIITRFAGELYVDIHNLESVIDEDIEVVRDFPTRSPIRALAQINPAIEGAPFIKEMRARADLMRDLNPMDITSAMEKQLDILTEIVLALADATPAAQPTWLESLRAMNAKSSSLQFKGPEACLKVVQALKQKLRDTQSKYYEACK